MMWCWLDSSMEVARYFSRITNCIDIEFQNEVETISMNLAIKTLILFQLIIKVGLDTTYWYIWKI